MPDRAAYLERAWLKEHAIVRAAVHVGIVIVVDAAKCLQQFGEERQPMLRYLM